MTSNCVTVLQLAGRANKLIQRSATGELKKHPGPPISEAKAVTVNVPDCDALSKLLLKIAKDANAVIIPGGFFPVTEPDENKPLAVGPEFCVSSKATIAQQIGVDDDDMDALAGWHDINGQRHIARLKTNMAPSNWMIFDRDEVQGMPENMAKMTDDEWWTAMCSMVPGLSEVPKVRVPSSTGRVLVDGKPMSASGQHWYVPIHDGNDLERFGATLLQRSFLAGYGFMRPFYSSDDKNKIISRRQWSIFDPTTFSRERIVYEGAPTLVGMGLSLASPQIEVL